VALAELTSPMPVEQAADCPKRRRKLAIPEKLICSSYWLCQTVIEGPPQPQTDRMLVALDTHMFAGLAIAAAFAIIISVFSFLQRERYMVLLGVLAAAAYHWQAFTGFVAVTAVAYAAIRWLNQEEATSRWRWACIGVFVLLIVFTLGRVDHWDRSVASVGPLSIAVYSLDMWLALRLATLFWEIGSGTISAPSFSKYIIWVCLPFTLGGPLLRLSEMSERVCTNRALWTNSAWWLELVLAAAKLVAGLSLTAGQQLLNSRWPQHHFLNNAVSTFFAGPVSFYLTTAGYFHLMEVLGRPAGVKLPPSFNYPLGRENISAFWMNWNMTATSVFRDYLFYNRWGRGTYNVYCNTIVLFTLVGLWHQANAYWILWGFLHGLLFCCFLFWRKYNRRLGYIPLRGTVVSRTAARALSYLSVCILWYLPSKILQKAGMMSYR
jgi:D-alanyl-lipoteichoic acid acyltransferase DltB (MBOAT superfamily)